MVEMVRDLVLFRTLGERLMLGCSDYQNKKRINCGIGGNETTEEAYLKNECPHCWMGVDYECGERFEEGEIEDMIERKFCDLF